MADETTVATLLAAFAGGYLMGSIPFGLVLTRMAGLGDVRSIGSGNIGATNVLRTGNRLVAAATLAADVLKGTLPVLAAAPFGEWAAIAAGFGAFIGHVLPVWLRFKGGKGVATFIGVQLGLYWPAAIVFLVAWLVVAIASRYASLASLAAATVAPVAAIAFGHADAALLFAIVAAIIFYAHRANIGRLLNREESKIKLGS
jgi:glycerol-3-phosphate acyltransferase PlsY